MGNTIAISIVGDERDLTRSVRGAKGSLGDLGDTAEREGARAGVALDGTAEGADTIASKGSQAAGALSGIGDVVATKFPAVGNSMMGAGMAMQFAADSGDLLNVAIEGGGKIAGKAVGIVKSLGSAETYAAGAKKASAAAQWALNVAMSANPLTLLVIAIAAVVAGLILFATKTETGRKIASAAFGGIRKAASAAFGWIKDNWPTLLAIITGPIGLAVFAVVKNWDRIKSGASAAKAFVVEKFDALVGYATGLPGRMGRAVGGMWNGLKSGFRSAVNFVIDGWNGLSFTLPEVDTHIPGVGKVGGWTLSTPNIPRLASGGITTGPTLALIGDNPGGREAVIPLDKYDLGGTTRVYVTIHAPVGSSPADIGRELTTYLRAYLGSGGRVEAT